MQQKSPCLKCELHHQGISKSCQECTECEKRIDYVRQSAASHGHGVEIQDCRQPGNSGETISAKPKLIICKQCGDYKSFADADSMFNRHASTGKFLKTCKKCEDKKLDEQKQANNEEEKTITCETCGKSWPESEAEKYFSRHASGKFLKHCRKCFGEKVHKSRKNKVSKHYSAPKTNQESNAKIRENLIIQLDFTRYKKHYDKLCEIAENEIRSPENQALYFLINGFNELQLKEKNEDGSTIQN